MTMIYKDDAALAVGLSYKKNVDIFIGRMPKELGLDEEKFWKQVKSDSKMLLKTSAEILRELQQEKLDKLK